ncbi:MAG: dicarboxylate/amino acid:cation symporter [Actinobacteria bacterium]|nr:dicarboxylate/amino acid:cation symporter [Actinomycetota bacterium]
MLKRISLPFQLLAVIFFVFFFGNCLPESVIRACYTFSVIFKELLNFTLPFIIFSFVLTGILSFKKNAPIILAILMGMIFFSNAIVAMISYFIGFVALPVVACEVAPELLLIKHSLEPFFNFSIPQFIRSDYVLLLALVLGIIGTFIRMPHFERGLHRFKLFIQRLINAVFIPFLPLYVLGFLLKVRYEGTFTVLFQHYAATIILIVLVQIVYLVWFYLIAAGFSLEMAQRYIKNAFPSYITAFSTMSSAASIPVTVDSAKKNIDNPGLVDMAIPIMANVHIHQTGIIYIFLGDTNHGKCASAWR